MVPLVIGEFSASHDECIDAEIGILRAGVVFTAEGVNNKLKVGGLIRLCLIYMDIGVQQCDIAQVDFSTKE